MEGERGRSEEKIEIWNRKRMKMERELRKM